MTDAEQKLAKVRQRITDHLGSYGFDFPLYEKQCERQRVREYVVAAERL